MKRRLLLLFVIILAALFVSIAFNFIRVPFYVSQTEIRSTLLAVADSLEVEYIYPEKGREMANAIRKAVSDRTFDESRPIMFAANVNKYLEQLSGDRHLSFFFQPNLHRDLKEPGQKKLKSYYAEVERQNNYGIHPTKLMDGDVGYLRMDNMVTPSHAGDQLNKALNSIGRVKAVVFDVRYNGGGEPEMVQTIISHFYPADTAVHINDIYSRKESRTKEYWTLGKKITPLFPSTPLYVLTSKNTFSAAEEFAYDLQQLRRAIVVGEKTGGGAHPGDFVPIGKRFVIFLPHSKAINPYSKTNWEKTGVIPDVETTADSALQIVLRMVNANGAR